MNPRSSVVQRGPRGTCSAPKTLLSCHVMIRRLLRVSFALALTTSTFKSVEADITVTGDFSLAVTNGVLINAEGQPFLIIGDSPQSLIGSVPLCSAGNSFAACTGSTDALPTKPAVVGYLRDRQAHGFNTIMVDLFCDGYIGASAGASCANNGSTPGGVAPFTALLSGVGGCPEANPPADVACWGLSTPNEAYFTIVDGAIQLAAQYGMQVMLVVIETGGTAQTNWLTRLEDLIGAVAICVGISLAEFPTERAYWITQRGQLARRRACVSASAIRRPCAW